MSPELEQFPSVIPRRCILRAHDLHSRTYFSFHQGNGLCSESQLTIVCHSDDFRTSQSMLWWIAGEDLKLATFSNQSLHMHGNIHCETCRCVVLEPVSSRDDTTDRLVRLSF